MKKLLCLLAAALLLAAMSVCALAESGYDYMVEMVSDPEILGAPDQVIADTDPIVYQGSKDYVTLDMHLGHDGVAIRGTNDKGERVAAMWFDVDDNSSSALFVACCAFWSDFEAHLDPGYGLIYMIIMDEDSELVITSEEEANAVVAAFEE